MRHGIVILPQAPWAEQARLWRDAESLGFDSAFTYDHLSWRSLAGQPWGATIPTLTAAASVTSTIRLGTFVASPNFRHPVPFAKELATLDDIAGGRVTLGVGSGGTGFDAFVLGQSELTPRQRHERFVEFVHDLDLLLRFEQEDRGISFTGDWFNAVDARMVGRPAQTPRIPILIAADGPKGMALAAESGDAWVTLGEWGATGDDWWTGVAEKLTRFEDAGAASGRHVERYLNFDSEDQFALESVDAYEDAAGRAEELGFDEFVTHWPRADGIYAGSESTLVEVASRFPENSL
ncbi:LLM class flavin-dependent oxidoreductase [Naasia lichenicola]|uniref:LLM class flavin-dependent oxidoreductase n=1 Tax=Naasia lichenicola TaxID=2565933 RepID=A0A4S4FMS1_9MICO|nr:LLM class flavin-dependent oxidoreductase [Naasia lichenicola]THG31753.1 LLM class flavin-dependent oxidoreductase [Naasia lichenicola]